MTNLVTLIEYKEQQGISSIKEDIRLNSLITSVSQLVKTYCGTSIIDYYNSAKTESINIRGATSSFAVSESPLISVSSVEEKVNGSYTLLQESSGDFYVDTELDRVFRLRGGQEALWPQGPGAVIVEYNAGFESTPEDLKLAVFDLITYYHKDEHKERKTLSGATLENSGTTSQKQNVGFPDHIKRVLDLYKVV